MYLIPYFNYFKLCLYFILIKNCFQVILNLLFVYYNYQHTVLNELPSNWFSPFSWLVSWPSSRVGTMSLLFWHSITNCVAKMTTNLIF